MRVAFFSDSFRENTGGLTRAVITLHDRLVAAGHAVRVFTLAQAGGPTHPGDVRPVRAVCLRTLPGVPPDSHLAWDYGTVRRELAAWRPDVVHLHTVFPVSWLGLWAARSLGIPVVATYHANVRSVEALFPGGKAVFVAARFLIRAMYNRCDAVIAPSRFAARELRGMGVMKPVAVISNGVDLDRFVPRDCFPSEEAGVFAPDCGVAGSSGQDRPVTVLFAGRLSPEKGVRVLAAALAAALGDEPRLRARIAGDGPLAGVLRQVLAPHIAAGRVHLLGHVPWEAMAAEYHRADVFLFPSPSETQGLAVLEAMATGLPVVAVRAGAVPELVRDGESGITVPAGDAAALAGAVVRLARDPGLRRRLGEGARAVAAEHEAGRVLGEVLQVYGRVAGISTGGDGVRWCGAA